MAVDIQQVLYGLGYPGAELAGSCADALERVAAKAFDLVLVDVKLRDGDCAPLVQVLQERATPFLYVSGYDPHAWPNAASTPWVTKPVTGEKLMKAMTIALEQLTPPVSQDCWVACL